jgi:uncharacterized protein
MRIELDKLQEKDSKFAHVYEPEELVLDDEHARLVEPPEVAGRVTRKNGEVRLRGEIRTRAEVECDRCLKAVVVPVETSFDVTYLPADAEAVSAVGELQEEDLTVAVFDGESIDVDELVREQVLLGLPNRALCGEDCKGLCPVCGIDRNTECCACETAEVDPRWGALKDIQF